MPKAEGQGEDIGHTGVHIGTIPPVGPQGSPGPFRPQNQGQIVSVGDDLEQKSWEDITLEAAYHTPLSLDRIWLFEGLLRHIHS